MTYFSRLTDIVTCSLTHLLAEADDPRQAIAGIIAEMEEGQAGARRSVTTATANEQRIAAELEQHRGQAGAWLAKAREHLAAGDEPQARLALVRKKEIEDVIGGLEQQHQAAVATREHMTTTLRALEARLAEARRRQQQLAAGAGVTAEAAASATGEPPLAIDATRAREVDAELESLRREMGRTDGAR